MRIRPMHSTRVSYVYKLGANSFLYLPKIVIVLNVHNINERLLNGSNTDQNIINRKKKKNDKEDMQIITIIIAGFKIFEIFESNE